MLPIWAGSCRHSILSLRLISSLRAICCWVGYLTTSRILTNDYLLLGISHYLWQADDFTIESVLFAWLEHLACLLVIGFHHSKLGCSIEAVCFLVLFTRWSSVVYAFTLTFLALLSLLASCIRSYHWRKLPWLLKFSWSNGKSLPVRIS